MDRAFQVRPPLATRPSSVAVGDLMAPLVAGKVLEIVSP